MATIRCTNCNTQLTAQQAGEPCPKCGSLDRNLTAQDKAVATEKAKSAIELAKKHFQVEPGLKKVLRFSSDADLEFTPTDPIKLLEVNEDTVPYGVIPLRFGPTQSNGVGFSSVIIEVTPDEYEKIAKNELKLPEGWDTSEDLPGPSDANGAA